MPKNAHIVSIDESGFTAKVKTVYGYSLKGQEIVENLKLLKDPKRQNLILAISNKPSKYGPKHYYEITNENTNNKIFSNFINNLPYPKGTYLLMDNASFHSIKTLQPIIDKKGYKIINTPPYSPEYNPIELVFGIIKEKYYNLRYSLKYFNILNVVKNLTNNITRKTIFNCFNHVNKLIESFE